MIRNAWLGLAAAITLTAAPASAATYVGTLNGVITSGTADHSDFLGYYNGDPDFSIDLVGKPITITFTADVFTNYTDPIFGQFYPKYVIDTIDVVIPAASPVGLYDISSVQSNDLNIFPPTSADYSGNAKSGTLDAAGSYNGDPDFWQTLDFTFSGASSSAGPLSGSGSATAFFYNGISITNQYSVAFNLTDGFVSGTGTGTPEPASWALMILGFGAIGATFRRQRVTLRLAAA